MKGKSLNRYDDCFQIDCESGQVFLDAPNWGEEQKEIGEGVERESERLCWGVAACVASAGVPARCGGSWARLGAWAPSLVCGQVGKTSIYRNYPILLISGA